MNRRTFIKMTPALVAGTKAACMAEAAPVAAPFMGVDPGGMETSTLAIFVYTPNGETRSHFYDLYKLAHLKPDVEHHLCSVPKGSRVWIEKAEFPDPKDITVEVSNKSVVVRSEAES